MSGSKPLFTSPRLWATWQQISKIAFLGLFILQKMELQIFSHSKKRVLIWSGWLEQPRFDFFFPSIWLILFIVLVYLCGWNEIMLCHCISMNCFLLHAMGKLPLHLTFIVQLQLNHCHNKTNFNHLCKTVRSSQMRCSPIVFLDPFLNRPTIFKSIVTSKSHWVPNP